jgi:hypothetical protein
VGVGTSRFEMHDDDEGARQTKNKNKNKIKKRRGEHTTQPFANATDNKQQDDECRAM